MDEVSERRVILTWQDIESSMSAVPSGARDILREILDERSSGTASADDAAVHEASWFLSRIEVKGHAGIGESPVRLDLPPQPGLTVVTARNGTGKTSIVHGLQLGLGEGMPNASVSDKNLHHHQRRIAVVLESGGRQVTLSQTGESSPGWSEGTDDGPVPEAWHGAIQKYQPVLLYPEVAKIIDQPDELYELLASALNLDVLEELQDEVDRVRKESREARKRVEEARQPVDSLLADERYADLRQYINPRGKPPDASTRDSVREQMKNLSPTKILQLPTLPPIAELTMGVDGLAHYVDRYVQTRTHLVDGTKGIRDALDLLADPQNRALTRQLENDTCPVCGAEGRGWLYAAQEEAKRLRELLSDHDETEQSLGGALRELTDAVPPVPELELGSLQDNPGLGEAAVALRREWGSVCEALASLHSDRVTEGGVREVYGQVETLRKKRDALVQRIAGAYEASHDKHASLKSAVDNWLSLAEANEHAIVRETTANRLDEWLKERIKDTRTALFEPIAEHAKQIWSQLDPDGGVSVTDLAPAGGTKRARKVRLQLQLGDTPVPEGEDNVRVLSTGQRNALSLATYLPRAGQQSSPFRFLVLDDPVQAFDNWRVRYLAQQLTELAESFQIVVFTHDDRLWREVSAHGHSARRMQLDRPPDGRSLVRVVDATSPGQLLLQDLKETLSKYDKKASSIGVTEGAISALTLAVCRQALDAEISEQVETLGRRCGKEGGTIQDDLHEARDTRRMLTLLDRYCGEAHAPTVDYSPHNSTISALNQGSHGQGPAGSTPEQRWTWLRETADLISRVAQVNHGPTKDSSP